MRTIAFFIPPSVELLDLAGPLQVFTEAGFYGFQFNLRFFSTTPEPSCTAGLSFRNISSYEEARLREGDYLFIPGVQFESINQDWQDDDPFFDWLKALARQKVNICSVCNAAVFLGKAGLLDNRECTTHWRRVEFLKKQIPNAKVVSDILFVKSGNIYTSAGISAGIDLALSILEELKGPLFVNKVARGLVVYHRRSHRHSQQSVYLDYRNHTNPKIHQVQDFIIENLQNELSIQILAELVFMSPRNLSRVFKDVLGITVLEYITKLRVEKANTLKNSPDYTVERVAAECGFKSARQLFRILNQKSHEK